MPQTVYQHTLSNGLVLLAERIDHVRSAAFNILIPAGCAYDPEGQSGLGSILVEMMMRGAGDRDSRQLETSLDELGVDRDDSLGPLLMRFWGSTLARNVLPALELYADILRRPRLPGEDLPAVQDLAVQDILAVEDSPKSKVMLELRRRYYPPPFNKDALGTIEEIRSLSPEAVRQHYQSLIRPNGMILSVAGNIEWEPLRDRVVALFEDWPPHEVPEPKPEPHMPTSGHLQKETHQTQIAFAWPSATIHDPHYYAAQATVGVLSGGMSSRLFTEVREKRGLCYSVGVRHESLRDRAAMVGYAGTGADRAQQTLEVTLHELQRLKEGVSTDEIDRVKAGLKSALIMLEESTSARAAALASDWYMLGRVRTTEELRAVIDGLTPSAVIEYLEAYPIRDVTLVTLGPAPLSLSV